jgi:hypothetical protein
MSSESSDMDDERKNLGFEKRLTVVENWKENMQVEMVNRLTDQVANKFNMDMHRHLPKVAELMRDYDILNEQFLQKQMSDKVNFNKNGETQSSIRNEI